MHRIDKRGIGVVRTATDHYLFISGQPGDFFWSSRPNQQITMEATAGGAIYIGQSPQPAWQEPPPPAAP